MKSKTYIEHACVGAVSRDDRDYLTEDDLVEANAYQHPDEIDDVLGGRCGAKVTVADRGEDLDCPVDTFHVD